jgi:hypothetical protein
VAVCSCCFSYRSRCTGSHAWRVCSSSAGRRSVGQCSARAQASHHAQPTAAAAQRLQVRKGECVLVVKLLLHSKSMYMWACVLQLHIHRMQPRQHPHGIRGEFDRPPVSYRPNVHSTQLPKLHVGLCAAVYSPSLHRRLGASA